MPHKIKLKTIAIASFLFVLGASTAITAQPLNDVNLRHAAQQLGVLQQKPATPFIPPVANQQIPVAQRKYQAPVKVDPYAAKRRQISLQNIARKKARLQRLNQLQRQKYQKNRNVRSQSQNNHRNVWNRIYQGFRIRDYNYQPLVKRFTNEFSRSPSTIQRLTNRSSDYLFMVVDELNRRGMPTELALLPFVESAYRNTAYSHAGAAGMWQFIPATGRRYGLQQTRSYDARLDPFKATHAALSYLQQLNREFRGDWLLALAAYNAGEYRVHREVAKNKRLGRRTDYWSLDLPRETKQYVPRLLAYKQILRQPQRYGIRLRGIPNSPALAKIHVNKAVNLRKVAAHAGLPPQQLLALNSGYLHGITTPRYSNSIILPRQYAQRLSHVIQRLPPAADVHRKFARGRVKYAKKRRKSHYFYHKVLRGETLYRIAKKHRTTVKKIKRLNKIRGTRIWPGKRLKIAKGSSSRSRRRA